MSFRQGARQFFERRGAPTPPLPYDAEVEYLESTGTQWLNTGIPISGGGKIFNATASFVGSSNRVYGAIQGFNNEWWTDTGLTPKSALSFDTTGNVFYTVESCTVPGRKYAIVDGVEVATGITTTSVTLSGLKYVLFAQVNASSTPTSVQLFGKCKVKHFSIKSPDGVLLIDFIPVRFTNELGQSEGAMYDRVSGALFRNAGTGAFTIGPDKS